jgi:hypothetical protein
VSTFFYNPTCTIYTGYFHRMLKMKLTNGSNLNKRKQVFKIFDKLPKSASIALSSPESPHDLCLIHLLQITIGSRILQSKGHTDLHFCPLKGTDFENNLYRGRTDFQGNSQGQINQITSGWQTHLPCSMHNINADVSLYLSQLCPLCPMDGCLYHAVCL